MDEHPVVGGAPQGLAPNWGRGLKELSELDVSHWRGLPSWVSTFEKVPGLEDGVDERRFERERVLGGVLENKGVEDKSREIEGEVSDLPVRPMQRRRGKGERGAGWDDCGGSGGNGSRWCGMWSCSSAMQTAVEAGPAQEVDGPCIRPPT